MFFENLKNVLFFFGGGGGGEGWGRWVVESIAFSFTSSLTFPLEGEGNVKDNVKER